MRKGKRIFAAALAAATAAVSASSVSANAIFLMSDTWDAPEGYTEIDDQSFLHWVLGSKVDDDYKVYSMENDANGKYYLQLRYDYRCNYARIVATDATKAQEIYNEYKDSLNFGISDIYKTLNKLDMVLYDEPDAIDSCSSANIADTLEKKDAVLEFVKALQDAGILEEASYYPRYASGTLSVYEGGVFISISADEADNLRQIAETVDSTVSINAETSSIKIEEVESLTDGIAVAKKIQDAYPDAEVHLDASIYELGSEPITSTTLDLTTAHYTGDIDDDETIDSQDALDTLTYVSYQSAGSTDATLTAGDDETEEAAALDAADVNADGEIDTTDAYLILKHYATEAAGGEGSWE